MKRQTIYYKYLDKLDIIWFARINIPEHIYRKSVYLTITTFILILIVSIVRRWWDTRMDTEVSVVLLTMLCFPPPPAHTWESDDDLDRCQDNQQQFFAACIKHMANYKTEQYFLSLYALFFSCFPFYCCREGAKKSTPWWTGKFPRTMGRLTRLLGDHSRRLVWIRSWNLLVNLVWETRER